MSLSPVARRWLFWTGQVFFTMVLVAALVFGGSRTALIGLVLQTAMCLIYWGGWRSARRQQGQNLQP